MEWYEYLSSLCKQKDIRQKDFCAKFDITDSHVSNIFNGKAYPSEELLEKILDYIKPTEKEKQAIVDSYIKDKFKGNNILLKYFRNNSASNIQHLELFPWNHLKDNINSLKTSGTVFTTIDKTGLIATQNPDTHKTYVIDTKRTPQPDNIIITYNTENHTPTVGKLQKISNNDVLTGDFGVLEIKYPYEIIGVVLEIQKIEKYV